jgi:RNA polymerase sigma factor (sigma-70 family)
VFLNAHRCLEEGVEPQSERAWLFKIAEHVVMYRRRTISRRARVEFPIDVSSLADLVVAPGREVPPELDGLPDALARIPEAQRRAIVLREWYGLSYREVASELGLSASAAETLIFRARRRLAQELGGPAPTERTRRPLGLASPLGALKWLLGGSASLKAVVGVTSVAVIAVGTTKVAPLVYPATRPAAAAPALVHAVRAAPAVATRHLVRHRAAAVAPVRHVRARAAQHPAVVVAPRPRAAVIAAPPAEAPAVQPDPESAPAPADAPAAPAEAAFPTDAGAADARSEASVESAPEALPVPPDAPAVVAPPPVADPGEPVGSPQDQGQGTPGPNEMASFGQAQRNEHASPNAADPGTNGQGAGPENGNNGNGNEGNNGNGKAIPEPTTDGAPDLSDLPAPPEGGPPAQAHGDPAHGDPAPPRGPGNDNGNESRPPGQDTGDAGAPIAL